MVRVRKAIMRNMMSVKFTLLKQTVIKLPQAEIMIPGVIDPGELGVNKAIVGVEAVTVIRAIMQTVLASVVKGTLGAFCNTARYIRPSYLEKELSLLKLLGCVPSVSRRQTMGLKSVHGACALIVGRNITPYCV